MTHISIGNIAQACHEANRVLQQINGETVSPHWDDAPDWQRESAMDGVANALKGTTPVESHENWCAYKRKDGWTYGPEKDDVAKTHPCLVPYEKLSQIDRLKDELFLSIVITLAGGST